MGAGFGPAEQLPVPLPPTATTVPDATCPDWEMEAYEQLLAAAGTGISVSQTNAVAATSRAASGMSVPGDRSMPRSMIQAAGAHSAIGPDSPERGEIYCFVFGAPN
ncbi:hypothetical protein AB0M87_16395 [Streptomyces sp. NPDC051320]|uniref:hypothetical protein n=1 Tax=Streptomyces sp. NPDC051320 TaxID=3154644 RepID=UPI0034285EA8